MVRDHHRPLPRMLNVWTDKLAGGMDKRARGLYVLTNGAIRHSRANGPVIGRWPMAVGWHPVGFDHLSRRPASMDWDGVGARPKDVHGRSREPSHLLRHRRTSVWTALALRPLGEHHGLQGASIEAHPGDRGHCLEQRRLRSAGPEHRGPDIPVGVTLTPGQTAHFHAVHYREFRLGLTRRWTPSKSDTERRC